MLGYLCAYMRYYHTKEFICAYLDCSKSDNDKYNGVMLAKNKNIKISQPVFRKSSSHWSVDKDKDIIYKGIMSIARINENHGNELFLLGQKKYDTFVDLLQDIKLETSLNKTQRDILIKLDFFKEFGDINKLLLYSSVFDKYYQSKVIKKANLSEIEKESIIDCYTIETLKQFKGINNLKFIDNIVKNTKVEPLTIRQKIKWKAEFIGFVDDIDENEDVHISTVLNVEKDKYNRRWITLYNNKTGKTITTKDLSKNKIKCEKGDVLDCIFKNKKKYKKIGNNKDDKPVFSKTGESEIVISDYAIIEMIK